MATTKKATSSTRKTPAKKSTVTKATTSAAKTTIKNDIGGTVGDNLAALKPGALIAEFLGTFLLAAAILQLASGGSAANLSIMFALIITVVVFGVVSGAHVNPAITIASWIHRKTSGVKAIAYIFMQVLGGLAALLILTGVLWAGHDYNTTVTEALGKVGVTKEAIDKEGGLEGWAKKQGFENVDALVATLNSQYGADINKDKKPETFKVAKLTDGKQWAAALAEFLGAVVFGLGIGYAFFVKKNQLTTAFAVGGALFLGLTIGGATAILNPAVAAAIGAFNFDATFWWSALVYIVATTVGMVGGVTIFRLVAKDALSKDQLA